MHRLVIAATTLLALIGAVVVLGYLFIFGAATDRAAAIAPARSVAYVSVYLTPSTGQQMRLADLLTKLPGLTDRTALGTKLDELAQRFLGDAGLDYRADVKPWIGDEVAIALVAEGSGQASTNGSLVMAAVRDEPAARAAIARIIQKANGTSSNETYNGVAISVAKGAAGEAGSFAILDGTLLAASDQVTMHAAVDAAQGRTPSLGDSDAFRRATDSLPTDRLALAYLDISGAASLGGQAALASGYHGAALALVARSDGLQVTGRAPFDASAASASARANFALGSEAAGLPDWMPATTHAELVFFGARQTFDAVIGQLGSAPGGQQAADTITQLRALAALGLGIDLDRDLLPLFDREAAVAVQELSTTSVHGQVLLRPSNSDDAVTALKRVTDSLKGRGSEVTQAQVAGTTVTTIGVPQIGRVAWAEQDGVIVLGLTPDDVGAALEAHASGTTLGSADAYRSTFDIAGGRGGNELYADAAGVLPWLNGVIDLPTDVQDILTHVGGAAIAVPTHDNEIEIHATVTVH
jgi:Protein of unknown function (DUF3352)